MEIKKLVIKILIYSGLIMFIVIDFDFKKQEREFRMDLKPQNVKSIEISIHGYISEIDEHVDNVVCYSLEVHDKEKIEDIIAKINSIKAKGITDMPNNSEVFMNIYFNPYNPKDYYVMNFSGPNFFYLYEGGPGNCYKIYDEYSDVFFEYIKEFCFESKELRVKYGVEGEWQLYLDVIN